MVRYRAANENRKAWTNWQLTVGSDNSQRGNRVASPCIFLIFTNISFFELYFYIMRFPSQRGLFNCQERSMTSSTITEILHPPPIDWFSSSFARNWMEIGPYTYCMKFWDIFCSTNVAFDSWRAISTFLGALSRFFRHCPHTDKMTRRKMTIAIQDFAKKLFDWTEGWMKLC